MVTLVEISNDDENSLKLDYLFVQEATGIDWKSRYQMSCILKQLPVIEQKDKSDFEYFVATKRQRSPLELASTEYLLLINGIPVSCINAIQKNKRITDITVATLPKYRRKGYAKMAVQLAEEKIFANPDTFFISITDITKERISSRIALSLGYDYDEKTNTFVKAKPLLEEKIKHL